MKLSNASTKKPSIGAFLLIALVMLISVSIALHIYAPILWLVVLFPLISIYRQEWELVPCGLLFLFMYQGDQWLPLKLYALPTAPFLVPFLLTMLCCLPFPILRAQFGWIRKGSPDQVSWFLVVITSLVSALALILWALWTDYLGIASTMLSTFRHVPVWFMLLVGIPGFALLNAFAEEAVYRGVLQEALEKSFGDKQALVLSAQASAFAAAHYLGGFPNGKLGYLMTFVYALMLGYLRERSKGMLAPYLAHVVADFVIGITLLLLSS